MKKVTLKEVFESSNWVITKLCYIGSKRIRVDMKHLILTILFATVVSFTYAQSQVAGTFKTDLAILELYYDGGAVDHQQYSPVVYNDNEAYYNELHQLYIIPTQNNLWGDQDIPLPEGRIFYHGESVRRYILTDLTITKGVLVKTDDYYYELYLLE